MLHKLPDRLPIDGIRVLESALQENLLRISAEVRSTPAIGWKRSAVTSNLVSGDPPVVSHLGKARLPRRALPRLRPLAP